MNENIKNYQSPEVKEKYPQSEKNKSQKQIGNSSVSFKSLFRFADRTDYVLMTLGTIASLIVGASFPIFSLLWGQMTDAFIEGGDALVNQTHRILLIFIYFGIGTFTFGWVMFACWMITAQRQAIQCRKTYLKCLLRQQIGWYDLINQSQLTSKFASDNFVFQGALGQKMSTILMSISFFISCFFIAFKTGWLMTLVIFTSIPALGISGAIYVKFFNQKDKQLQKFYNEAGGKAQQALSQIKTVKQLNGQQFQLLQYVKKLQNVQKKALKYALYTGIAIGIFFFFDVASYALGFWFGSQCVQQTSICPKFISNQTYTAGDVIVIFFCILFIGYNFSSLLPAIKKFIEGRQAAQRIFKIIDRQPLIKNSLNPLRPKQFQGFIKFQNVTFAYPKDKSKKILKNLNLQFKQNLNALVGESGCGKSTIFQLILRFYDPDEGRITVDGIDIRQLDLNWLREHIGYVGQEPVLFATTIKQNLLFGKQDASEKELSNALKNAEVQDFVQTLDKKLQTFVGHEGGHLSGGQKQRIAIARALLKNPKILLLDQATSALDRKNERLIQTTLDKISQNRISITIAHRAKTIMKSDIIYVISQGQILQSGKFNSLQRFKKQNQEQENQQIQNPEQNKSITTAFEKVKIVIPSVSSLSEQKNQVQILSDTIQKQSQKEKKHQQELLKKYDKSIFRRIFKYASQKKLIFLFGAIVALLNGLIYPTITIFLSKMLTTLFSFNDNPVQSRKDANLYSLIFFSLSILAFFINVAQSVLFSIIGQDITKKIRFQVFNKILRMPISWFDNPRNNAGSLTAKLSSDCNIVNGLATSFIAIMIQNISCLVAGITIALIFQWRTALIALGLIPFLILAGVIQMAYTAGFNSQTDTAYKQSSNLVMQAILNVKTIYSFNYQKAIQKKYSDKLVQPLKAGIKNGIITGLFFGLAQFLLFIIFGLIFYIGALFIRDVGVSTQNVFTAIYGIVFSAMSVGNTFYFLPDIGIAKVSAANLFEILDCEDQDQIQIKENSKLIKSGIQGNIQLKNIQFKYGTRNDYVFKNLNLNIKKGLKIGLVGHSGCGKSTIFQLLLRFYEPSKGQILIDKVNIKQYDIHYLRSCFGVVSQEPVLFNQSFRNNIIYNIQNINEQRLKQVCRQANALTFIKSEKNQNQQINQFIPLSQNRLIQRMKEVIADQPISKEFERNVGVKGNHLSGGQKQRIAIARALLRNPKILLLDQATSALDDENQKQIQLALEKIMIDKTMISIAHRIQTIKNCDQINVFQKEIIVEKGTYKELMDKKGYFYSFQKGVNFL